MSFCAGFLLRRICWQPQPVHYAPVCTCYYPQQCIPTTTNTSTQNLQPHGRTVWSVRSAPTQTSNTSRARSKLQVLIVGWMVLCRDAVEQLNFHNSAEKIEILHNPLWNKGTGNAAGHESSLVLHAPAISIEICYADVFEAFAYIVKLSVTQRGIACAWEDYSHRVSKVSMSKSLLSKNTWVTPQSTCLRIRMGS